MPPAAKRVDYTHTEHGVQRADPYFWLRDDERKDPKVLAYLEAENAYTKAVMKPTEALQKQLFEELKGRIKKDDSTVPTRHRGYWYYTRFEGEKEYPIYCRRKGDMEAAEEVTLDGNERAKGHDYYAIADYDISENETLLAFSEDTVSRRLYTIRVKNLATGEVLSDAVPNASGSIAWGADNKTFFYVKKHPKTLRPYQVFRHTLGTEASADVLVWEEKDEAFYVSVRRSRSHDYILINMQSTLVSEVLFIPAKTPHAAPKPVVPRAPKHEYGVAHKGEHFYIRTNSEAVNFRLVRAPVATSGDRATWEELIPAREDVLLASVTPFDDYLALSERKEGQRQIRVRKWDGSDDHYVAFDQDVYVAYPGGNPELDTSALRYHYGSPVTPDSIFEYDMASRTRKLLKQDEVLGGFDAKNYKTERIWVTARDGAKVPVSLVFPKDFHKDGKAPLYQYAYGSYGYSIDPWFNESRLSLLDRGFAVAIAHIRGGQEMGRQWYDNGKMFKKMNTFTDFIDVSEALIAQGYTSAEGLFAGGGSAGGLLMGAVANMRPELYKGIYAAVPFVDVVSTMLDESIPLTTGEFDEWGNPKNKDSFDYMLSYSPYDQVKKQAYPHLIITTGLHDSQVQYWEPAKWLARLRHRKTDGHHLLMDTDMDTGHGGASGRFKKLEKTAKVYAFFLYVLDPTLARWTAK